MTKARQKGVQKVNEMKKKARENKWGPLRVHRMNWKVRFRVLTGWRPKNDEEWMKNVEERLKIFAKSPTKTLRKRYRSASAWIFFTETIFSLISSDSRITRRTEHFFPAPLPLFIGKWGRSLPPSLPRRARLLLASSRSNRLLEEFSGRPKWAWFLFAPLFLLNTPPCSFLVILFPKRYETLRIS